MVGDRTCAVSGREDTNVLCTTAGPLRVLPAKQHSPSTFQNATQSTLGCGNLYSLRGSSEDSASMDCRPQLLLAQSAQVLCPSKNPDPCPPRRRFAGSLSRDPGEQQLPGGTGPLLGIRIAPSGLLNPWYSIVDLCKLTYVLIWVKIIVG